MVDTNGDGTISAEEVASLLPFREGENVTHKARMLIRDFDTDNDGTISWEEFYDMLSHGNTPNTLEFYDSRLSSSSSDSLPSNEFQMESLPEGKKLGAA